MSYFLIEIFYILFIVFTFTAVFTFTPKYVIKHLKYIQRYISSHHLVNCIQIDDLERDSTACILYFQTQTYYRENLLVLSYCMMEPRVCKTYT